MQKENQSYFNDRHKRLPYEDNQRVLTEYLTGKTLMIDLFKQYSDKFKDYDSFRYYVALLQDDTILVQKAVKNFQFKVPEIYIRKNLQPALGYKTTPYWSSYEESIYKPIVYADLTPVEREIYDKLEKNPETSHKCH